MGAGGAKAVKLAIQKSPAIRAKAEKFAEKSGEYIKETLQNIDLPRHARNAFETMLGKQFVKAMDARLFIMPEGEQVFKKEVDETIEIFLEKRIEKIKNEIKYKRTQIDNAPTYNSLDIDEIAYKMPLRYLFDKAKSGNDIAREILENFETAHEGRGYAGYSMSNNAVDAYENGHKPLSKFDKADADALSELTGQKWKLQEVKQLVQDYGSVGYHHTSKFYNKTNFYSIAQALRYIADDDPDYFRKLLPQPAEKNKQELDKFLEYVKENDKINNQIMDDIQKLRDEKWDWEARLNQYKDLKSKIDYLKNEKEKLPQRPLAIAFYNHLRQRGWNFGENNYDFSKSDAIDRALDKYHHFKNKLYLKDRDELKRMGYSNKGADNMIRLGRWVDDFKTFSFKDTKNGQDDKATAQSIVERE